MKAAGRPKIKEEKRKVTVSLSLSPAVVQLAEQTGNKSHFVDTSVQGIKAVALIIDQLRKKEISLEDAIEEISDASDIWNAEFDDAESFVRTTKRQ